MAGLVGNPSRTWPNLSKSRSNPHGIKFVLFTPQLILSYSWWASWACFHFIRNALALGLDAPLWLPSCNGCPRRSFVVLDAPFGLPSCNGCPRRSFVVLDAPFGLPSCNGCPRLSFVVLDAPFGLPSCNGCPRHSCGCPLWKVVLGPLPSATVRAWRTRAPVPQNSNKEKRKVASRPYIQYQQGVTWLAKYPRHCSCRLTEKIFVRSFDLRTRTPSSPTQISTLLRCEYLKSSEQRAPSRPFALRRSSQQARTLNTSVSEHRNWMPWRCVTNS